MIPDNIHRRILIWPNSREAASFWSRLDLKILSNKRKKFLIGVQIGDVPMRVHVANCWHLQIAGVNIHTSFINLSPAGHLTRSDSNFMSDRWCWVVWIPVCATRCSLREQSNHCACQSMNIVNSARGASYQSFCMVCRLGICGRAHIMLIPHAVCCPHCILAHTLFFLNRL